MEGRRGPDLIWRTFLDRTLGAGIRPMATLDLGRLLRLRGMVEAAAGSVDPDGAAAPALTESYMRLREQVAALFEESHPLLSEFQDSFPEIEVVETPTQFSAAAMRRETDAAEAIRARTLLEQLKGWLTGLIEEQTFERRLELEAAERVKQERRQPPGFSAN